MEAFGLNFCHGLGLGLHERPLISRLTSFKEPIELKAGMVFAVETYCPRTDGISAARIEEEVILNPRGREDHSRSIGRRAADRKIHTEAEGASPNMSVTQKAQSAQRKGDSGGDAAAPVSSCRSRSVTAKSAPTTCSCRTW